MEAMASSQESTMPGSAIVACLRGLVQLQHWLDTLETTTTPEEITAALRDMLGYERVTLYLKEEAVSPASHPWPPAEASGLVAWVLDQGASLLVSDGRHDARCCNAAGEVMAGERYGSAAFGR
jgi:hypothetical protein